MTDEIHEDDPILIAKGHGRDVALSHDGIEFENAFEQYQSLLKVEIRFHFAAIG